MKKLTDLKKAIKNLREVLEVEVNDVVRDSSIKRFELCYDLAWKSVKEYAVSQGVECYAPRECFKMAFELGLIDYNEDWIGMVEDRNLATHVYREAFANELYGKLGRYLDMFETLAVTLSSKLD